MKVSIWCNILSSHLIYMFSDLQWYWLSQPFLPLLFGNVYTLIFYFCLHAIMTLILIYHLVYTTLQPFVHIDSKCYNLQIYIFYKLTAITKHLFYFTIHQLFVISYFPASLIVRPAILTHDVLTQRVVASVVIVTLWYPHYIYPFSPHSWSIIINCSLSSKYYLSIDSCVSLYATNYLCVNLV